MELEELLSPSAYKSLTKKIERQKRFKTDGNGETLPFIYKLSGTGVLDKTVKPHKEMNRDAYMEEAMQIYDPWAKGNKFVIIRNVTGKEAKLVGDGAGGMKHVDIETTERIVFESGYCYVPVDRPYLLAIMMFSHHNMSKPNEMKAKNITIAPFLTWTEDSSTLFTGVEINKVNDIMLRFKAIEFAKKYTIEQKRELLNLVSQDDKFKLFSPLNKLSDAIDNDFFVFANDFPREFLDSNVTDNSRLDLMIHDAKARNIITHDLENGKWIAHSGNKNQNILSYNKVNETNPDRALFDFLLNVKNEKTRMWIESLVKPKPHPYLPEEEAPVKPETPKEEVLELV